MLQLVVTRKFAITESDVKIYNLRILLGISEIREFLMRYPKLTAVLSMIAEQVNGEPPLLYLVNYAFPRRFLTKYDDVLEEHEISEFEGIKSFSRKVLSTQGIILKSEKSKFKIGSTITTECYIDTNKLSSRGTSTPQPSIYKGEVSLHTNDSEKSRVPIEVSIDTSIIGRLI